MEESRPYTVFYVEVQGYFWYTKMPFGLTGAPSTFAHMTVQHLHDLLAQEIMELFIDDGGAAADTFEVMMTKLVTIFGRIWEQKLSLSVSKSKLFMTTVVFASATAGLKGVQPDLAKLTVVVNWKEPADALNLAVFLGLTSWFQDLIKGYVMVEKPLRDLLHRVELPQTYTKLVNRRTLLNYKLPGRWTSEHAESFFALKKILTSEPVLRGPRWDGTHFIVMSDGCQDAFGAVLVQKFKTVMLDGCKLTKLHPIGFALKRTSHLEAKNKPFLLEFSVLKFALDKFSNIIWGFPVQIEMDCQELWDIMMNDKLNATHARWRDGILSQQIVDV